MIVDSELFARECQRIQIETNAAILAEDAARERRRPCHLWRPRIYIDGNQWCALYGDNIQDGVAGFGDSPEEAMASFDAAWSEKVRHAR